MPIRRPRITSSPARVLAGVVLAALPLAAAGPAAAGHDTQRRDGDYEQVLEILFPADPVATSFSPGYHAPRSGGRVHKATDVMGPKLTPLYATVGGTVCHVTGVTEPMPSWGYALTICAEDGRRYRYIHLNNDNPGSDDGRGGPESAYAPGIRRGNTVHAGQLVGFMGDSGNAEDTAPHLHFEILDDTVTDPYGDHRIDPYPSLAAAAAAGRVVRGRPDPPRTATARVAGPDRVGTAIAVSRTVWPSSPVAVVALSVSAADALVSGPLAARLDGPVLLTPPHAIEDRILEEIRRLAASRVVLVGGAAQVPGADAALSAAGVTDVERISGPSAPATAAAVAARMWGELPANRREAVLALGWHPEPSRSWPDALTASWFGAVTDVPVLLTDPSRLPPETESALTGSAGVTVIGGPAAVSEEVVAAVSARSAGLSRLYGAERYATAVAVAEELMRRRAAGTTSSTVWAATGRNWADAVTAGAAVARGGDLFALVDGADGGGDPASGRFLWRHGDDIDDVRILGGSAAVDAPSADRLARRTS